MTVCPICNGKGTQFIADYDGMYDIVCDKCKGKGELDENGKPILTNEEWLRQANNEEMEHTLTMLIMKDRFFADKEFAYVNIRFGVHCWLKEKHNDGNGT